jgi:hypothetical protein
MSIANESVARELLATCKSLFAICRERLGPIDGDCVRDSLVAAAKAIEKAEQAADSNDADPRLEGYYEIHIDTESGRISQVHNETIPFGVCVVVREYDIDPVLADCDDDGQPCEQTLYTRQ